LSPGSRIVALAAAVVVAGAAVVLTLRAGWWDTDRDQVSARWAAPPSEFITIDGVELHVRDEGEGPVVVLLHGSILNLHEWDPVAERLKSQFRVLRLDWPPYGLSGPDPTAEHTTARAADLIAGLLDHLQVDQFSLVATSNGVNVALDYNARYPGHVNAMALSVLPLERPSQTREIDWRIRALMWFHNRFLPDWHSKYWWRLVLEDTTPPDFTPPDEMVDMMYDMNNLPGAAQRQREYIASNVRLFQTIDMGAQAEEVTVPVLVQWCEQDTVISQDVEATLARFTRAPVTLISYPQFGHFPMWEDPDLFTADLAAFLNRTSAS
jgi:pimeloyl-ACP methyl ester carboxylesterase